MEAEKKKSQGSLICGTYGIFAKRERERDRDREREKERMGKKRNNQEGVEKSDTHSNQDDLGI